LAVRSFQAVSPTRANEPDMTPGVSPALTITSDLPFRPGQKRNPNPMPGIDAILE
jgi:hypothetical protein